MALGDEVKIKMTVLIISVGFLFFVSACTTGPCRSPQQVQRVDGYGAAGTLNRRAASAESAPDKKVLVYKYDGSLQCKMGKPVSLDQMRKDLKGIPVFSMEKRLDGQAHIQVCGSITGQANVFEISGEDIAEAEKRGFRVWTFNK